MGEMGRLIDIGDTGLWTVSLGEGPALVVLHGGPGLDHHAYGDYLDPLADRYHLILVDQRSQGRSAPAPPETWSLAQMARDVSSVARALGLDRYGVLGHSYGAFVALQHAVDHPGDAAATIVSSGVPSSSSLMDHIEENLDRFEPIELREQVRASWEREQTVTTPGEIEALLVDQMPFHFADPRDPRIADFLDRTSGAVYSPEILKHFSNEQYGGIEVEDRLMEITQPVLVLAGRHDRTCSVLASKTCAAGIQDAELVVFPASAHMTYVEENGAYLKAVRGFLDRTLAS